jgi:ATP-binding cassette subfamily B protein
LLLVFASFAEIVSIGAVLPFLGVLTAPDQVFVQPSAQPFIKFLGLTKPRDLLLPLTIAFGLATLLSGVMRLFLLWVSTRLSFATGADLSVDVYRRSLYQPYKIHVARNSSEVINGIHGKTDGVIYTAIMPVLTILTSVVMITTITVTLLYVDPLMVLTALGGFGLIYAVIIGISRNQLLRNSRIVASESTQVVKSINEGLGGIRDILIDGTQPFYSQIFDIAGKRLRRAQSNTQFISTYPRYGMEALGIILIATLGYVLTQQTNGLAKAIPVLGALAIGAQRLLPVLQQAYAAWSGIQGGKASLQDVLKLLDQPLPYYADLSPIKPVPFHREIALNQIWFRYSPHAPWVLKNLNLRLRKGERIGVIGATGSGKSTLLDLIMGLLEPTEGTLEIDHKPITLENHRSWQIHIAHVPQTIFLADCSIEENIAFGVPKGRIDPVRVRQSARKAQIASVVETWPKQYETFVGERGILLSGGQRQRIGIARAFYKQADVIIFDEATSALDNEVEEAVMQGIIGLGQDATVLIIAHRLTTLKNCTVIVELADGVVKRVGSYQDIVEGTRKPSLTEESP